MRIEADISDETHSRVEDYAERYGLRMSRAYDELIRTALDADDVELGREHEQ